MPRLLPFSSNACLTEWNSTECRAGKFVCDIDGERIMMEKDKAYETNIESCITQGGYLSTPDTTEIESSINGSVILWTDLMRGKILTYS